MNAYSVIILHITGGIIDNIFMETGGIIDNISMETGGLLT